MKTLLAALGLGLAIASSMSAQGFTGTYGQGHAEDLPAQDLDFAPLVIPLSKIVYPDEIRGTQSDATIGVVAWLKEDGTVNRVLVTHGSDRRLREPVQHAVGGWRFSAPNKNSKHVAALVRFRVRFTESGIREITFSLPKEPNQSPQHNAGSRPSSGTPKHVTRRETRQALTFD
jgi:hypothetical protein